MKKFFADTFCFLALMNPRDRAHERTIQLLAEIGAPIFTTQWVLVEAGDAFCNPRERGLFKQLLTLIESDARIHVVSASKSSFARGVELYLQRKRQILVPHRLHQLCRHGPAQHCRSTHRRSPF